MDGAQLRFVVDDNRCMHLMLPGLFFSLAIGIWGGYLWRPACTPLLLLAGSGVLLSPLLVRRPLLLLLWIIGGGGAAGAAAVSAVLQPSSAPCHVSHHTGRELVRLQGAIEEPPLSVGTRVSQILRAELLMRGGDKAEPLCGRVELYRSSAAPPLWPGTRVIVRGRLRSAVGARMPGVPSAALRRKGRDIGALIFADEGALVVLKTAGPSMLQRARLRIKALIDGAVSLSQPRAVVTALLLGDRGDLDPEVREQLARAGVSHVLAVSGLHLSLVSLALMVLLRWLLIRVVWLSARTDPRRLAALLSMAAAVVYTLFTGAAPATVRACVMICSCMAGLVLSRAPDLVRPLALAGLGLLTWDPLLLLRPSFQLSFTAVAGIAMVARLRLGVRRGWPPVIRWLVNLAAVTTAAALVTAPVVAHHFHQVSLAGLLCNMIVIPLCSFILLPLSLAGALAGLASTSLGSVLLFTAGGAADFLLRFCSAVASLEFAALDLSLGGLEAVGCCVAAAALLWRGIARRALAAVALVLLAVAWVPRLADRWDPPLEVLFLDVGQGDSALLKLPGGAKMLIDGGGAMNPQYDPGSSRVVPLLRAEGIRHLDYVVASHPHPDHIKGLGAVLDAVAVGELWICWHDEPNPWLADLRARAARRGVVVTRPRRLESGPVSIRPLWPQPYGEFCADPGLSGNDNSIVLHISYGRAAVLMTGDIEVTAERQLVERLADLPLVRVLKVPHHGSDSSSSGGLLDRVSPALAVISCGVENPYGFPAASVLRRYQQRHISVARVDQLGALEVRLWPDGKLSWRPLCSNGSPAGPGGDLP